MNHLTMQLASFRCLLPVPLLLVAAVCNAEDSAIQSTARPQGLQPITPVQVAAGDAASTDFQQNHLPGISRYVNETLGERSQVDDSTMLLDTSILKLQNASDVRVYFVGEGAGYHNTLGLSTTGQKLTGDAGLLFPDASTASSRSLWNPLQAGDYVDAGRFNAGVCLDFFLIANGAYGGSNTYWSGETANPDGINHMVALAVPESPYLIIGFEDLYGGGDRDFNDLVFAVDIGKANVEALIAGNEPAAIALLALLVFLAWRRRQSQQRSIAQSVL